MDELAAGIAQSRRTVALIKVRRSPNCRCISSGAWQCELSRMRYSLSTSISLVCQIQDGLGLAPLSPEEDTWMPGL